MNKNKNNKIITITFLFFYWNPLLRFDERLLIVDWAIQEMPMPLPLGSVRTQIKRIECYVLPSTYKFVFGFLYISYLAPFHMARKRNGYHARRQPVVSSGLGGVWRSRFTFYIFGYRLYISCWKKYLVFSTIVGLSLTNAGLGERRAHGQQSPS